MSRLLLFLILLSCAQVTSLNLQKHQFGRLPTKIVWIQAAGLTTEQIAMLKFSYPSRNELTAFENSLCIGNAWEYNLFEMRPSAYDSFLSQVSGKKNIKNSCEDYAQKPIWKYIYSKGYKVGIFEGEADYKDSLIQSKSCNEQSNYLKETTYWTMNKSKKSNPELFHVSDNGQYKEDTVYFDKSCLSGDCFTTSSRNIEGTFSKFTKNSRNYLYIVRNFSLKKALKSRNVKVIREELDQLSSTLKFFQDLASKQQDMLVLLTTAEGIEVDLPESGLAWKKFDASKAKLSVKNSKLLSPVFASGARAENFCGIYDQSQILSRIFSGAKQQGLEFSIINPFD